LNTKKKTTPDISAANRGGNLGRQGKKWLFE